MNVSLLRLSAARLFRPLMLSLPRGGNFLYRHILGDDLAGYRGDAFLRAHLARRDATVYDRRLRARVLVDLTDWACRAHYFLGRYHDTTVPLLIDRLLPNGGVFIDVGANRGIHTLYAARHLADRGSVHAFEPHPETFAILRRHVEMNNVTNCHLHNMGLGDQTATLSLNAFSDEHSGTCSFLATNTVARTYSVPVRRLDDILPPPPSDAPVLLKIDTEGFEFHVLRGAMRLLDHPNLGVYLEVTDEWLQKTGGSADALFAFMRARNFHAFTATVTGSRRNPHLALAPLAAPRAGVFQYDVLFTRTRAA